MYHHRIEVTGPPPATAAVTTELVALGARVVPVRDARVLVLASPSGIHPWPALTARHPGVVLAVETFEEHVDDYLRLHVAGGAETVMTRGPILGEAGGGFYDEDGEPLDPELLRAAARSVATRRLSVPVGALSNGLDTALAVGCALGRFSAAAAATLWQEPAAETLEAVRELGVVALWVSGATRAAAPEEQEFRHALRLTRAALHAGRSELADRPGSAFWEEWLSVLLDGTTGVIEVACHAMLQPATHLTALGHEHFATAEEQLAHAALSLLATCLETLALFDPELAPDRS